LKIAINDTNILIDFFDINLLNELLSLDLEMHTSDFVLFEIEIPEQLLNIENLVAANKLKLDSFSTQELGIISQKENDNSSLSLTDCSVWHWAKMNNAILLTGDGNLRKTARNAGIEVHGSLWLLDLLVEQMIINSNRACSALTDLMNINSRLPKQECEARKKLWCN
jgi:rRNA-processing protein FCF1